MGEKVFCAVAFASKFTFFTKAMQEMSTRKTNLNIFTPGKERVYWVYNKLTLDNQTKKTVITENGEAGLTKAKVSMRH